MVFVTVHCDPLMMERGFENRCVGIRAEGGGGRGADERPSVRPCAENVTPLRAVRKAVA
jgi:hypothetical protein